MANNEATTLGTVLGLLYPGFPQKKERYITFALLTQHAAWRGCDAQCPRRKRDQNHGSNCCLFVRVWVCGIPA